MTTTALNGHAARSGTGNPRQDVLDRLQGVVETQGGNAWHARCPAHDDRRASLSVSTGRDGRILMRCHAGCQTPAIVEALGLGMADLFPADNAAPTARRIVAAYDYVDEAGVLLYQAVRYDPKGFSQRRPDGAGGWTWSLKGVRRVLYRLPGLLAAPPEQLVFVVEGEKDVDRLAGLGLVGTTNAMGAGKWQPVYNESLRGRHVVIIPDNDDAGHAHAAQVARALCGVAASVKVLELAGLPHKGDVSDWITAGGTAAELLRLAEGAPESGTDEAPAAAAPKPSAAPDQPPPVFRNFFFEETQTEDGKRKLVKVGLSAERVHQALHGITDGWPKRTGKLLFVEGAGTTPLYLDDANDLFAWLSTRLDAGRNENPSSWADGEDKLSRNQFFAYEQQAAENFEAVEPLPHWPPLPGYYYMHPDPAGGDGGALDWLLHQFNPATDADFDLLMAAALTPGAGIRPGQRPAILLTAEEDDAERGRGVGKTTWAKVVSRIYGGHIEARPDDNLDKLITRLLSHEAMSKRVVVLDNIKTLRFSNAEVEGVITADRISGHRLYKGEGQRPNTLTWFLTLNGASLSRDMAQRCVIIRLKRPPHNPRWEEDVYQFIDAHRWAIIGDIIAKLKGPGAELHRYSRWSAWEQAVLSRVADPSEAQKVIEERQHEVDDDDAEADVVRSGFIEELKRRGHSPDTGVVFIPTAEAARILGEATGEKRPTNRATTYLRMLNIPELRKSADDGARGWRWTGRAAQQGASAMPL